MIHKLTLTILCGNAAMQTGLDLAQALREAADSLESLGGTDAPLDAYDRSQRIHDANGNTVGEWKLR